MGKRDGDEIPVSDIIEYFQKYSGWEYVMFLVRRQRIEMRRLEDANANLLRRQGLDPDANVPLPSEVVAVPPPPPRFTFNRLLFLKNVVILLLLLILYDYDITYCG